MTTTPQPADAATETIDPAVPAPAGLAVAEADAPPVVAVVAGVARIHGEPMLAVPQDLYIPPDALQIILESFEGPLDLLLYLIRKQNFNILDIPMAEVTRQYLGYIESIRNRDLELASDYLLMAALLIEIKSRMLLPRPPTASAEEEDPRAELARRLLEYEQIKLAAQQLASMPQVGRDFEVAHVLFERLDLQLPPRVDPEDLKAVWLRLLARARLNRHHRVTREELSVREHMSRILRRLKDHKYVEFFSLFEPNAGVPVIVVNLLALLELCRESMIHITQQAPFAPIHVRLAGVDPEDEEPVAAIGSPET